MIRKGKHAKVTYAKRGEVISPVNASTRSVMEAVITPAVSREQKQAEVLRVIPEGARLKKVMTGTTVSCSGSEPQVKNAACRNAEKDITLNTLFSEKE